MKNIQLSKGKFTQVDDDDYEWLNQWKWYLSNAGYAVRMKNRKSILMARVILQTPDGLQADHINGDKLDNRKCNLRNCTRSQNQHNQKIRKNNTSGFMGVSFHKKSGKWQAMIGINGKRKAIGIYDDPVQAGKAYDAAALEIHGIFATINNRVQ